MSYKEATRRRRKSKGKFSGHNKEIERKRILWKQRGPVWFAEHVLHCPDDIPSHPDFNPMSNPPIYCEGCETDHPVFKKNAKPYHLIVSQDQNIFLTDLWLFAMQGILSAGRGCGKTFSLAIYICWRVACFDWYSLTCAGGSSKQSQQMQEYIDYWRIKNEDLGYCIPKSTQGAGNIPAHIRSRWGAKATFPPCSETSARGPHVIDLILDEVCSAEKKSKDGRKAVRAARWQVTGTEGTRFLMTSTSDFVFGTFLDTIKNYKKYNFRFYRWAIARHKSDKWFKADGMPDWDFIDTVLVNDRNPKNWIPNVWWITQNDIHNLRTSATDDEWLVEALGGIGRGSGLLYSPDDMNDVVCRKCEECIPWVEDRCKLMKALDINLEDITQRVGGADFGGNAPNALIIVGKWKKLLLVLYADEKLYQGPSGTINWMLGKLKEWLTWLVMADPEERGMIEMLEVNGISCPDLWALGGGVKKNYFVTNSERWVEKKLVIIPKKYEKLVTSMEQAARDDKGKVIKHNDHSLDGFIYALSEFPMEHNIDDFWNTIKEKTIGKLW